MAADRAKPTVSVIGLGNIGGGVARNLVRSGHRVFGLDLDESKVDRLITEGAWASDSFEEAISRSDVVFTSLPGPKQILEIAPRLLAATGSGTTWVELSTNNLNTARQLHELCTAASVKLIDAPVSGGPEGAEAGSLSIFVGGDEADVADVMPLLAVIGSKVDHLGANGTGIVAKIAQVTLCYTQTVMLTEALLLGVKGGIDPAKMLDLIQNSAGGSYVADSYGPEILAGTYDASFPISHAAKDMRLASELAATVGATVPFMTEISDLYDKTVDTYGPDVGHLFAAQIIERQNGVVFHEAIKQQH